MFLTPKTFSAFVCYVVAIILMYILLSKFPLLKYKETGEIVYIWKRACVQNSLNIIQHYDTCRTFGVEGIIKCHFRWSSLLSLLWMKLWCIYFTKCFKLQLTLFRILKNRSRNWKLSKWSRWMNEDFSLLAWISQGSPESKKNRCLALEASIELFWESGHN